MIQTFTDFLNEGAYKDFVKQIKSKNWVGAAFHYEVVKNSSSHDNSYKKMKSYIDNDLDDEERKKLFSQIDTFI
jgi:hypothetical protein